MIDDGKNKGSGEFDDDAFDEDFVDTEFDEAGFDEDAGYDDLPEGDADYEGDDFEVEDWGDAEEEQTSGKKGKKANKQKSGGGGGLSFNAMVIIGAVLLGGAVLVFNVMRETGKAEMAQGSIFRSILNIGGIMDGTLFGDKEEETAVATPEGTPTDTQGFLNDPSQQIPAADQNGNPPQPSPIAPTDGIAAVGEPLTPMPTPSAEAPRGPDDVPPAVDPATQVVDAVPAPPENTDNVAAVTVPEPVTTETAEAPQSAEDILKKAMAEREQKLQEEKPAEAAVNAVEEKVADAKEKIEETAAEVKEEVKEAVAPIAEKVEEQKAEEAAPETPSIIDTVMPPAQAPAAPVVAVVPEETKQEITANKEAVSAVESKLDTLLKRMDQIETDLGAVRDNKTATNTQELEKTVAALREEIAQIKARPVETKSAPREEAVASNDMPDAVAEPAPAPKPAAKKKKKTAKPRTAEDGVYSPNQTASVPAKTASPVAAPSGRWELRAAQPGRAWVSKPGTRDMQAVAVGDTLPGIGRINAITYMNGRWTVSGAQGSIQQ